MGWVEWNQTDLDYLDRAYESFPNWALAEALGRTQSAVQHMATRRRLKKAGSRLVLMGVQNKKGKFKKKPT